MFKTTIIKVPRDTSGQPVVKVTYQKDVMEHHDLMTPILEAYSEICEESTSERSSEGRYPTFTATYIMEDEIVTITMVGDVQDIS